MTLQNEAPDTETGAFYTEKEVAALLRVGVKTLRNWRSRGEGPRFRKIGKRCVRYARRDLVDFINESAA